MSDTRKLFESIQNNLNEAIKSTIEYAIPIYTGGGIYVYIGKLNDENYFIAEDSIFNKNMPSFSIRIVNKNPEEEDDFWNTEWQEEHLVKDMTDGETETKELTKQILDWVIKNQPDGNYDLGDIEDKRKVLNNINEDENIDGQISFDDLERAKNPIFKYYTKFNLESPVNDFEAAQSYLTEDDMTQYLLDDDRIPQSGRDKVKSVTWDLKDNDSGTIWVITTAELTEEESAAISDWISGQNSDGLGEGFEQQSFAENYYNPETGDGPFTYDEAELEIEDEIERLVEEQYEDYLDVDIDEATDEDIERAQEECRDYLCGPGSIYDIDDWYMMSSFDWQYNKYKLTLKDINESALNDESTKSIIEEEK